MMQSDFCNRIVLWVVIAGCFYGFLSFGGTTHVFGVEPPLLFIENARVVVGNGEVDEMATVVVQGDRIQSIQSESAPSASAHRIDGRGKTVIPGIIDAHVHFDFGMIQRRTAGRGGETDTLAPEYMKDYLRHGVTTVKSCADPLAFVLQLRARVNEGMLSGPRVLAVGPCFTAPGGHPVATLSGDAPAIEVEDEETARMEVRRLAEKGVDAIKAVLETGGGRKLPPSPIPRLSPDVLHAIVEEAHRNGLPVTVHTHRADDVRLAVEAGADGVEHGVWDARLDGDQIANLLLQRNVYYTPTLAAVELHQGPNALAVAKQNLQRLYNKGIRICVGTDTLVSAMPTPGLSTIREMELMAEAGLPPGRIIRAATRDAADLLGLQSELGTIEPGKIADLVVVDGNPLKDIAALRQVHTVVQSGSIVYDASEQGEKPTGSPRDANPVCWFEIPVVDMPRAVAFYEGVLGVKLQAIPFGPLKMALFPARPGTTGVSGALMKGNGYKPSGQGIQIYFYDTDIDATLRRLDARGATVVLPKTAIGPFGFIAVFEDSEGNHIGLRSWR